MNREQTIAGYRILGDRPKGRDLSFESLKDKDHAAVAYAKLEEKIQREGANCLGDPEFFAGEVPPSDRDAMLRCSGCPAFRECAVYLQLGRPDAGVWAGRVQGRKTDAEIEQAFKEAEER